MMDKRQLRNLIRRVLIGIGGYSEEAENLLMGTAAQESALGEYIRQLGNGPALGIFQMEPRIRFCETMNCLTKLTDYRFVITCNFCNL